MNTMRAMMLTGKRRMALRRIPLPRLKKPDDVLLRIDAVGVCGSDVHYYLDGRIGCQVVRYPYPVGHECAGTVKAVGRSVRGLRPGDRVAIEPAVACGVCDQCRCGRPHTCRNLLFLGCPNQLGGSMTDFMVMPARCCYTIPAGMTAERAALVEPLSIGLYAADLAGDIRGRAIGILGSGPIGLCVLLSTRLRGAGKVYITDKIEARLKAAQRAGATWTGNPDRTDIVAAIGRREPLLLDVVFECCGQQAAVDQALKLLKPGGTLVMVGIPTVPRIALDIDLARRKEIAFQNVRRQNHCFEPALRMLANGTINADFMITHRFPFERSRQAFEQVAGYRDGVIKAMLDLRAG